MVRLQAKTVVVDGIGAATDIVMRSPFERRIVKDQDDDEEEEDDDMILDCMMYDTVGYDSD
jgi:hypothetical protein